MCYCERRDIRPGLYYFVYKDIHCNGDPSGEHGAGRSARGRCKNSNRKTHFLFKPLTYALNPNGRQSQSVIDL